MKITPTFAAIAGASLVAAVVAFVWRPPQLAPHPAAEVRFAHGPVHAVAAVHAKPLVYVAGAVAHPGVYAVSSDARAQDALAKAGGPLRDADLVAVNLAARVTDGDEIAVPRQGEARPASTRQAHAKSGGTARRTRRRPRHGARSGDTASVPAQIVDINTAGSSALAQLPGIGQTLAERIVEFRTLNGPFASVDGLADVAGITPQRLDELSSLVSAGH